MPPQLPHPPDQLLSLHHAIARLLPPPAASDAHVPLSNALFRACRRSPTHLHDESHCFLQIWQHLRAHAVSPTPSQLNVILQLVRALHHHMLKLHSHTPVLDDPRLQTWNDVAAAHFEHLALVSNAAQRVHDPLPDFSSVRSLSPDPAPAGPSKSVSSAPSSSRNQSFHPSWLRTRLARLPVHPDALPPHEMAASILPLLADRNLSDQHLQSDLFDAFHDFDAVADVLSHRPQIRQFQDAILADCAQAYELSLQPQLPADPPSRQRGVRQRRKPSQSNNSVRQAPMPQLTVHDARNDALRKQHQRDRRRLEKANLIPSHPVEEEDDEVDEVVRAAMELGLSAYEERQRMFPGVQMDRDAVIGSVDRITLPKGSTREVGKGYEQIFVPPPVRKPVNEADLVDVQNGLADHPALLKAMKGVTTLNRLQSAVFPVAFHSDENLLVCAPTGAGKTNVALLTIFREIVAVKMREKRVFKVVYVAPMKALAAEVTEKFSARLGPLGLVVKEFTGDMSLSRAEALETHVLVTTPEKWDVVTRKTGSEVGESVTLFIVDEIHLLHDDRGAVLESIVARTLRFSETAQKKIRLVGLSATLPNYKDVGSFMRVNPEKGLFHFDGSHRPVPLSQTFIGISEGGQSNAPEARRRKESKMHELTWKKIKDSLQRGHQAMIFVHSRKGTGNAAREMISRATQDDLGDIFLGESSKSKSGSSHHRHMDEHDNDDESEDNSVLPTWAAKEISKSKTADIRELCSRGVGIHNAGLPRPDRKLVERLFAEGVIRLLCCTATLAWGVNLPARTVVIMGTEVYNAEKGGFVQLGMLDVMQIFGRAGRPQFDTEGEGTIITGHEHLAKYLNLLTSSIPIESQLGASASRLADHLNAEIVSGTVSSIGDGVRWLNYTYLSVRMPQNPLVYGIDWKELEEDFGLHSRRSKLIENACKELDDARMSWYDPETGALSPTDLGRVSSHFYVSHETIVLWNELFSKMTLDSTGSDRDPELVYSSVIHAVSCATEFEQMRSRQEESDELDLLTRKSCPIPLKGGFGSETREGKVAILLQAHISRANIRMSDLSYIVQSATRLLRALFEISLRRGLPSFSLAALELARASESRIWPHQHPLWQFTYLTRRERGIMVTPETIAAIETSREDSSLETLRALSREELSILIRAPRIVQTVEKVLNSIPTLQIVEAKVAPLSRTVLSIRVKLAANFRWHDSLHGNLESWWLWVEDKEVGRICHSQKILLTKKQVQMLNFDTRGPSNAKRTIDYNLTVAVFDPPSSQYWIRVESDRWHTGGGSISLLSVASMQLPSEEKFKPHLARLSPTSVQSPLNEIEAEWFGRSFSHFNSIQMAALKMLRFEDSNVLVSAPAGCGKTCFAEFAILRAMSLQEGKAVVFISPDQGFLEVREKRWKGLTSFGAGRMLLLPQRGGLRLRPSQISSLSIILATPSSWSEATRMNEAKIIDAVSLFIFNDLHRLSESRCVEAELLLSRIRGLRESVGVEQTNVHERLPRVVGLCEVLPNAAQLGDWIGVSRTNGLLCLGPEARQVSSELQLTSIAGDRYGSRMQAMTMRLYSTIQRHSVGKPVLIFVASRRQTLLTAQDLLRLASIEGKDTRFIGNSEGGKDALDKFLRALNDVGLLQTVPKGIGLYHDNMSSKECDAVEALFRSGRLQVLIATFSMKSRLSARAHSVIVKGTEVFDSRKRRFEDISSADLMQMTGHAGRIGTDSSSHAVIFVHEPKQTLFKMLLHSPLPVESGLLGSGFEEVVLGELVSGRSSNADVTKWLKSTFFFQRLHTSPGLYGLKKKGKVEGKSRREVKAMEAERRSAFCEAVVDKALSRLEESSCIVVSKGGKKERVKGIRVTSMGKVCCEHRISVESGQTLYDGVGQCGSVEDVMELASQCKEIYRLGDEYGEDKAWSQVVERVSGGFVDGGLYSSVEAACRGLGVNGWIESGRKRGKLLGYGVMVNGFGRIEGIDIGRGAVVSAVKRIVESGMEIGGVVGRIGSIKGCVRTLQCVASGRLPTQDVWRLCGVEHRKVVGLGRDEGWKTVEDVLEDEVGFAMFVAKQCEESERSEIMRWVEAYPRVRVGDVELKGDKYEVVVGVRRKRGGGGRREGMFVVAIWDLESGGIVGLKKVQVKDGDREETELRVKVDAEMEAGEGAQKRVGVWVGSLEHVFAEGERVVE